MDKKEIGERLRKEGYESIRELSDPANIEFPEHDHAGDHVLVVIKGSIEIAAEGKKILFKAGETFYSPAKIPHSAKIGPEGCEYIVGEKPAKS